MITNHNPQDTRKDGFKIPEGYFETFESRLFDRLNTEVKQPKKNTRILRLPTTRRYGSIAAAIALLLGVGLFVKQSISSTISTEALESYLEYNQVYTLSNDYIQSFDEKDIKELEQSIDVSQKAINDYVQTNIDLDYYLNY